MTPYVQPIIALPVDAHSHLGPAAVRQIVDGAQLWLDAETGYRLRVANRVIVVTVPWRASAFHHLTPAALRRIDGAVPHDPGVLDVVFYDAQNTWAQGRAFSPGRTAVLMLGGMAATARNWSLTFLHEFAHMLGIGHVTDDPCDLMAPWACGRTVTLDADHRDYWATLLASPYLERAEPRRTGAPG